MCTMIYLSLMLLGACSNDGSLFGPTSDASDSAGAEAQDTGSDSTDTADAGPPAWFTFAGRLPMVSGAAEVEGAEGRLVLAGSELDRRDCAPILASAITTDVNPAVEASLYAWWQFDLSDLGDCAAEGLPARLGVGIGELHPEVRARLGTVDREDDADALYGAWLSDDEGSTVFAFGYADAGSEEEASAPPPDGLYELVPLLLLPLPPQD